MTWITWNGGKCPVEPETVVEVTRRDGMQYALAAELVRWSHRARIPQYDIIAYRVVDDDRRTVHDGVADISVPAQSPEKLDPSHLEEVVFAMTFDAKPEKPFSTRITEAEEKALEAVQSMVFQIEAVAERSDATPLWNQAAALVDAIYTIQTAAALARDYARKEG